MVTDDIDDVARDLLRTGYDQVLAIPKITVQRALQCQQTRFASMYTWFADALTKFNMLGMTQYDKVAFLDCDMLCVAAGADDVFKVATPAGICDWLTSKRSAKQSTTGLGSSSSEQESAKWHGQRLRSDLVRRSLERPFYAMRGCILLLHPSAEHLQRILDTAAAPNSTIGDAKATAAPDEHFITTFYQFQLRLPWYHLHERYGWPSWAQVPESWGHDQQPVFLHYVSQKPWVDYKEPERWPDYAHWDTVAHMVLAQLRGSAMEHPAERLFATWTGLVGPLGGR